MFKHHWRWARARMLASPSTTLQLQAMGYSFRKYLLAEDDRICRLEITEFDRMLRNAARHRIPGMAGQRIRMADLVVLLENRKPICVVRATFALLSFDAQGHLIADAFLRQQFALAESALAPAFVDPDDHTTIVDASSRFVAQGGRWTPSTQLARRIEDAALGRLKCPRLTTVSDAAST